MPTRKNRQHEPTVKFPVGSRVRVKKGTPNPDFPDFPLGGWTGKVREVDPDSQPPRCRVEWDRYTLHNVHPVYQRRCEREGLDLESMWLEEDGLEPDRGEPASIEQPTAIVPRPLDPDDQEDRIRAVLGLRTGDEPIPRVGLETLRTYYCYLTAQLSFPIRGRLASQIGPHRDTESPVSVIKLLDVDDYCPEETAGLICKAKQQGKRIEYPLDRVDVEPGDPNHQLVDDYACWFSNWA